MNLDVLLRTDATGTRRRLQALHHDGYGTASVAAALGVTPAAVCTWLHNNRGIDVRQASAVADLYRSWSGVPAEDNGSSAQDAQAARALAHRRRWKPQAAWRNQDMDNPAAVPMETRTVRRAADVVEDAEWLRSETGGTWEAIAARLKIRTDTLHQYRMRVRRRQEAGAR